MQIDSIKNNMLSQTESILPRAKETEESSLSGIFSQLTEHLRNVNLNDDATYEKDNLLDSEDSNKNSYNAVAQLQATFQNAVNTLTTDDLKQMEELGFAPEDMDPENFVTIADQIKMQLAKAGVDVSAMGGLDSNAIAAMTGSAAEARDIQVSLQKASEIAERMPDGITEDQANYLIQNKLNPTIDNLYNAVFSQSAGSELLSDITLKEAVDFSDPSSYEDVGIEQLDHRITDSGFPVTDLTEREAAYLFDQELPITRDTMALLDGLYQSEARTDEGEQKLAIIDAVMEGAKPSDAMLLTGFSIADQVKNVTETLANATEEDAKTLAERGDALNLRNLKHVGDELARTVTTEEKPSVEVLDEKTSQVPEKAETYTSTLREAQLLMTRDNASYLVRQNLLGIAAAKDSLGSWEILEEADLSDIVEEMKAYTPYISEGETEAVTETLDAKQQVLDAPAAMLGGFTGTSVRAMTLQNLTDTAAEWTKNAEEPRNAESWQFQARVNLAEQTYEAVGTEVRRDLGDSIQKAFQNVDDILRDLNLEQNADNERAVRILGYNSMEVTTENVLSVREADQTVRETLEKLKPAVVLQMIKNGENPLRMTMEELSNTADQYKENSNSDSEGMGEFLFRMEQTNGISDAEKESYIGIYRMIHQVNKRDGAAIGKLLETNQDVTLENLMTAVRTAKSQNREYTIDDETGLLEGFEKVTLTINQQIETAFQSNHLKHAEEMMTPAKLQEIGEENYLAMSPAAFDEALSETEEPEEVEEAFLENIKQTMEEAASSELRIFEALERMDLDSSATNLLAMNALYVRRNEVFKNLLKPETNADGTVDETSIDPERPDLTLMLEELMERYGEACKTPEEMAEAQERLADLAENAMEGVITEDETGAIDIRTMQLVQKQMGLMTQMARDEIYHVPIMVADEMGNMTLKIVRGEEDKGLVAIALHTESLGDIAAELQVEDEENIEGTFTSDRRQTQQLLSEQRSLLAEAIQSESGMNARITFSWNESMDVNHIYEEVSEEKNGTEVQTTRLYSIARALIKAMGDLGV